MNNIRNEKVDVNMETAVIEKVIGVFYEYYANKYENIRNSFNISDKFLKRK
jgi:hypothetical protein